MRVVTWPYPPPTPVCRPTNQRQNTARLGLLWDDKRAKECNQHGASATNKSNKRRNTAYGATASRATVPLAITFERKNRMPTADCLAFGTDKVTIAKPTVRHKPYHNMSKHSPRPRGRGHIRAVAIRLFHVGSRNRHVLCLDLSARNHQSSEHHRHDGDRPQRTRAQ